MKKGILILTDVLHSEGAENVTVNIAVRLKQSDAYSPIVCATRRGGVLEEKLRDHGVKCVKIERRHRHEVYKFHTIGKLIKEENVKLIHAHKLGSNIWGVVFGKIFGLPAVSHVHGQVYNWKNYPFNSFVGRLSSKLITVSEFERKALTTQVPADKVVTIYNGIDPGKYKSSPDIAFKESLGLKPDAPVVGISAALRKEKAHEVFLRAAKEVLKKRGDVHFLIIGGGVRKQELEAMASGLGIRESCIFTGFVKNIEDALSVLDVGVLTSEREGLPLTLLEYMASSKPIIATDVGGVSEVVRDGENGFLVPSGDHITLAGRINVLLEDPALASTLGANGRALLGEKFSEDVMMNRIEALYDDLTRGT
jgi:glycosyltransferase involved in cell wall biosynthesis